MWISFKIVDISAVHTFLKSWIKKKSLIGSAEIKCFINLIKIYYFCFRLQKNFQHTYEKCGSTYTRTFNFTKFSLRIEDVDLYRSDRVHIIQYNLSWYEFSLLTRYFGHLANLEFTWLYLELKTEIMDIFSNNLYFLNVYRRSKKLTKIGPNSKFLSRLFSLSRFDGCLFSTLRFALREKSERGIQFIILFIFCFLCVCMFAKIFLFFSA